MKSIKILVVFFLLQISCKTIERPSEEYFTGTWLSLDGAKIIFHQDGSCILLNFNYSKTNPAVKVKRILNGSGIWKFEQDDLSKITITYSDGTMIKYLDKNIQSKQIIVLKIGGKGVWENSPPWYLYVPIGDPDDYDKYIFEKTR